MTFKRELKVTIAEMYQDHGVTLVDYTAQGDYVGDVIQRANREYLLETYPNLLTENTESYGYSKCAFLFWDNVGFNSDGEPLGVLQIEKVITQYKELESTLNALHDYPVCCEHKLSELEMSIKYEYISEFVKDDLFDFMEKVELEFTPTKEQIEVITDIILRNDNDKIEQHIVIETGCLAYINFDSYFKFMVSEYDFSTFEVAEHPLLKAVLESVNTYDIVNMAVKLYTEKIELEKKENDLDLLLENTVVSDISNIIEFGSLGDLNEFKTKVMV
jgi:hypothetical protein